MTQAVIVVGQTFTATCETSLASLGSYANPRLYYERPDGFRSFVEPTIVGTTMVGTITPALNPLTVSGGGKWADGYAGTWRFYPYVEGSGTIVYRGKTDKVLVSKQFQD